MTSPISDLRWSKQNRCGMRLDPKEAEEIADHIDAQAAKIKALTEACELALIETDAGVYEGDHTFPETMRAALAAAKEPT